MKILFIFLQIVTALPANHQKQVNSVKDLPRTVETLVNAIQSDNFQAPSAFIMTLDELRTLNIQSKANRSDEELKTLHERGIKRAHDRFRKLKEDLGQIQSLVSWDTLTYFESNVKVMDFKFVFNTIHPYDKKPAESIALMEFIVTGDRLLMDHSMNTTSELHYDLHVVKKIDIQRYRELRRRYGPYVFDESETTTIPFQSKGKWGLISIDGQVVVQPTYDSISKFNFNYYHVVSKKAHNLLDKEFKPVFRKPKKNIRVADHGYEILNSKGEYEKFTSNASTENHAEETNSLERVKPFRERPKNLASQLADEYYQYDPYRKEASGNTINIYKTDSLVSTFKDYSYLDLYNTFIAGRDTLNNSVVARYNGEVVLKSADAGVYTSPGYEKLYNRKTRLFGVYCPFTDVLIQPKYRYIQPVDRDRYFIVVTKEGKLGYLDRSGKELF
jgi:hypothetical protein